MKKKILAAAALAAVTLLAACGEPEGNNSVTTPTAAPVNSPAQPTAEPASNTSAPATNTAAPASNTTAPAATSTAAPKPEVTSQPAQTAGNFDAIAGSWYSSANNTHGNLSLEISSDGSSSLGALASDGDGRYHVVGTTMTLSLEKWADGSERLYYYDSYTYEDATYSRKN